MNGIHSSCCHKLPRRRDEAYEWFPSSKHFLEDPEKRIPLTTAKTGYHPGETR